MHSCILKLLGLQSNSAGKVEPEPEEIEMLCKLMFTIGKELDHPQAVQHIDSYFSRIKQLGETTSSSRLRYVMFLRPTKRGLKGEISPMERVRGTMYCKFNFIFFR